MAMSLEISPYGSSGARIKGFAHHPRNRCARTTDYAVLVRFPKSNPRLGHSPSPDVLLLSRPWLACYACYACYSCYVSWFEMPDDGLLIDLAYAESGKMSSRTFKYLLVISFRKFDSLRLSLIRSELSDNYSSKVI